jgi:hypothetical protein
MLWRFCVVHVAYTCVFNVLDVIRGLTAYSHVDGTRTHHSTKRGAFTYDY